MASRIKEIGTVCRFCLCQEGLIAMSDAIGSVFAAEDVLYYTGIQISGKEELPYAICHVCCKVIRNSVRFRSTCLKNDTIIKKLLLVLKAEKSTNVPFEYPAASMGTFGGNTPRSNTETITLDESDSDDSPKSLHGEAMQEASNDIAPSVESEQRKTSSTTEKESVDHGGCVENEKSTSNEMINQNDESVDLMSKDDSDSDSSMPSLYGESMVSPVKNDSFTKDANEGKVQCHLCGTFQRYFYNHMKRVHQKKHTFSCPYCPKQLSERYYLKDHINTWHKKHIKYTCQYCGKGYTNYDGYFYHLENSHGKSNSYECETCHKKWKSIDSYRKHRRTHSVTAITCKDCGRIYKNNVTFEQHLLQYHPT